MTTKIPGFAAGIALLVAIWLPAPEARAQMTFSSAPAPIEMVAVVANGQEKRLSSLDGVMEPVGLPAGGQIALTLVASTGKAGQRVAVRLLDGGEIVTAPALAVASDGTAGFTFKAGDTRGLYRVEVTIGTEQYELQLYAVTP